MAKTFNPVTSEAVKQQQEEKCVFWMCVQYVGCAICDPPTHVTLSIHCELT